MSPLRRTEHAVARALAESIDPRDAYQRVLAAIGETVGWELGSVWVPADDPQVLTCVEIWRSETLNGTAFESASHAMSLGRGEGLPGRVWQSGLPAWILDVTADPNFPRSEAAREAGLRSAFCFPVRGTRGVLGAIEFFAREAQELDDELLATMTSLGEQIGQAIERRRAEDAVRQSEARERAILDAALDCIITMDHRGKILGFNPAAERTFGYSAEEVVGRDMAEIIIPPDLRDAHREGLARYLDSGQARVLDRRIEIEAVRADGSTFPVELAITRIDVPGPPTFAGHIRDITDRLRSEQELRASRARIVEAADAARRRLERDLHDGAQQRLVELALDLRMARSRLEDGPRAARELIDDAIVDLAKATDELRELARGLHPAVLTEGGLQPALSNLAARASLPVALTMRATPTERYAPAVEATAYFVVAEALTNVARYAQARRAHVSAIRQGAHLVIEVRDDGRGGADPTAGSGLLGLADRVAAMGGRLDIYSPAGNGTTLRAEIPCE